MHPDIFPAAAIPHHFSGHGARTNRLMRCRAPRAFMCVCRCVCSSARAREFKNNIQTQTLALALKKTHPQIYTHVVVLDHRRTHISWTHHYRLGITLISCPGVVVVSPTRRGTETNSCPLKLIASSWATLQSTHCGGGATRNTGRTPKERNARGRLFC